jgi:hypothetical protein
MSVVFHPPNTWLLDKMLLASGSPVALCTDCWMRGALTAARAAASARSGPVALPIPSMAVPAFAMMVRTSAKSTLMRPGTVMMSLMPCNRWEQQMGRDLAFVQNGAG